MMNLFLIHKTFFQMKDFQIWLFQMKALLLQHGDQVKLLRNVVRMVENLGGMK